MAMVFTLVTTLKESAEELVRHRRANLELKREAELRKVEEEENRRFHGTAVTKESFLAWREKFRSETEEVERQRQEEALADEKRKRSFKEEVRLTGKQLWERGLVSKGDEEDDDGEDALEGVERLKLQS
jgi:hypothetical protein